VSERAVVNDGASEDEDALSSDALPQNVKSALRSMLLSNSHVVPFLGDALGVPGSVPSGQKVGDETTEHGSARPSTDELLALIL
jgi:hypothetical protein